MIGWIREVVMDCAEPRALARFWAGLLDGTPVQWYPGWVTLEPPGGGISDEHPGGHVSLAFQKVEDHEPPTWPEGARPQQFHLDFAVPDIDDAEAAVLAAGATVHEHQPSESGGFRVYLDPAGHPFCLCRGTS